ncbi:glycosyltransferase family 4 protein [Tautonia sociabilis]|uniref:Glycosyltransferase n=1 Tax=Tautonia sociabilis TaxID=2080755 RepID=A0A432MIP5_9BACT|nr:glycosyltransferase [Tautonia sociabilis]RUL87169.1 glycosyltransferase [Tautonia sociabilis]
MHRRLRIAVWHNLPSGGGKRALHDHVRGLVARGHELEAWCPATADTTYLPLAGMIPEHVVPCELPRVPRRGRWGWTTEPYRQALAEAREIDRAAEKAAEEIRRGGFDLLFAGTCLSQFAPSIGRFVDLPSVLYLQEPNRDLYEARFPSEDGRRPCWLAVPNPPKNRRIDLAIAMAVYDYNRLRAFRHRGLVERANAKAFDTILVNSLFSRESVARSYDLEARICYLGIDTAAFRPLGTPKERFIIGLGGLHPAKRPDIAIRAIGTIEPTRRPPLFWIGNIAKSQFVDELTALASSLGVDFRPRVGVAHEELVDLLGRASAMVYAPRLEPFGYAPLEANACGTPVVAVAEGGIRESLRDGVNGTLLLDPDPEPMGKALLSYADDLERSSRDGALARRDVEQRWSLDAAIDRLEAELLRIVSRGGSKASSAEAASGTTATRD